MHISELPQPRSFLSYTKEKEETPELEKNPKQVEKRRARMKLSFSPCRPQSGVDPRKTWEERNSLQNSREIIKVSGKVSDLKAWKNLGNIVNFRLEIPLGKNEWSVTAEIWSDQYQEVLNQSFVKVLEIPSEVIGPTDPIGPVE